MPFVVPNICRFALNQRLDGRDVVNVLDYQIDTTGSTMDRVDAIREQAELIIDRWVLNIRPWVVNDLTLESVSYVDLNAADGTTGSVESSPTNTLPLSGEGIADPMPSNVSALITKQVTSARGRRNGRMFQAGIGEDRTAPESVNVIRQADLDGINVHLADFLAGTNNDGAPSTEYDSHMSVVHVITRGPSPSPGVPGPPLTGGYNHVESLVMQGRLATQRRRLRG